MLEELFVARDVAEIKCIPLSQSFAAIDTSSILQTQASIRLKQGIMQLLNCWVFIVKFHRKENGEIYGTRRLLLKSETFYGECVEGFSLPSYNSSQKV